MLTVACVLVKGHVKTFSQEYVERLHSVVNRVYGRHHFICLTDQPKGLSSKIEPIEIKHDPQLYGWWSKLQLFNKKHMLGGRTVYFDLDTLPVRGLEAIENFPASFALAPTAGNFQPSNGLKVIKKYNSSVMVFDPQDLHFIYDDWCNAVTTRLWGDQDWIAECVPDAATMPMHWFPRLSELEGNPPDARARVVLCKKPKNEEAARKLPWFKEAWC